MGHKVTSRSCPTCGQDKGSPQEFEVAEVPVVEVRALEELKAAIASIPKPAELPPTLAETLAEVAKAGQHMEATAKAWETQRQAEAERAEAPSHQAPTQELIEHWSTCSNCAPGWQKIWDNIAANARKDYVPAAEVKEIVKEVALQVRAEKGS